MSVIKVNSIQHSGAANASIELNANGRVAFSNTVSIANDLVLGGNTVSPFANAGREIVDLFGSTDSVVVLRNPTGNTYLQRFSTDCYLNNQTGNTFLTTGQSVIFQAGGSERMRIDSSGRVTTPNQPLVRTAGKESGGSFNPGTAGAIYPWANAQENIGGHWNDSTNRFTCPIAGRYLVSANLLAIPYITGGQNTSGGHSMFIRRNGINIASSRGITTNGIEYTTACCIFITCAANDILDVWCVTDNNNIGFWADFNSLTIALVG